MHVKLAIIGASYLQLPLVQKAKEMGVETHCFAWTDGAVCKDYCDFFYDISVTEKETILKICKELNVDGVTTIATDLPMITIAYITQEMGLVGNSFATAVQSTDKAIMRSCFDKEKVSSPKFLDVSSALIELPKVYKLPVIVKPVDRSGSRGVTKVDDIEQLEKAISIALEQSISGRAIVEEFIEGQEVSVETISWKGKHYILAVTDKVTTGAPHFVELEHHQPSDLSSEIIEKIKILTLEGLNAVGITYGAAHTEVKINEEGMPFIIEIGGRMGGDFIGSDLVRLTTGYDYVKAVINVALNIFEEPTMDHSSFAGVYFLADRTAALIPYFKKTNSFDFKKECQNIELKALKNSNDRSGYLIYQSDQKIKLP
jgi:biotin carboxylase